MNCSCIQNEDGLTVEFCRQCAAGLTQRSPEWFQARCKFVTGSRVADALRTTQKGWAATRGKYADQLLAERLTGRPWGIKHIRSLDDRADMEPEARTAYSFYQDQEVTEVGFIHHLFVDKFGCSPDGLCGDKGLMEIKILDPPNHIKLWEGDESIIEEYKPQIVSGLSCTSREWCDLVSYCPWMIDEDLKLFVKTFYRDEDEISRLECAVQVFIGEVETRLERIRNGNGHRHQGDVMEETLRASIAMVRNPDVVVPMKRKRGSRR